MATFFQVGALIAFFQGIYDGDYSFEALAKQGDFGIGTLNGVNGEVIAVDGIYYRIDAHGIVSKIAPDALTPFAQVCHFQSTEATLISDIDSLEALNQHLDTLLPTANIFYMIRIDGDFKHLHYRSESCQPRPYAPLAESLPKTQTEFKVSHSSGTLAVVRSPAYCSTFSAPGYHYHYIDNARQSGGHVFDLQVVNARVQINPCANFTCNSKILRHWMTLLLR